MTNNYKAPLQTTPNSKYDTYNSTPKLILEKASGNWPMILESLGINPSFLKAKHGPCPVCGGKDRFRFDNKGARGTFFCNNCKAGDGIKLLQNFHGWSFQEVTDRVARVFGETTKLCLNQPQHVSGYMRQGFKENSQLEINPTDFDKRREYLNSIWAQAKPILIGDPVDCYLKSRGISLGAVISMLRFHPALPYYDNGVLIGHFPAMLAKVQNGHGNAIALHRTYLGNGCKANVPAPKKIMPSKPNVLAGAAIRLFNPINGVLALAEGIETALSVYSATEIPAWSTINACGMERIVLPLEIKEVTIAADNDTSGRGQEAAHKLKARLISEGRSVKIVMPPNVGQDFNDLLLEAGL